MTTQHLFTAASRPLIRHARRPRVRHVATIAAVAVAAGYQRRWCNCCASRL